MFDTLKAIYDKITGKKKEKKDESYTKVSEKEVAEVINTIVTGRPSNRDIENNTMMKERYEKEQRNLVHPVTKEVVKPLKNVNDDPKTYIKAMSDSAYGPGQWPYLEELIRRESSWNSESVNESSGAFGLFQANPSGGQTPPNRDLQSQWEWGYNYINNRYGTPQNALRFHDENGWY